MTLPTPRVALLAALPLLAAGCESTTDRLGLGPVTTVQGLELDLYLGTWYEIGSFPQRFQEGCHGTTANYALSEDGETIAVTNRCFKDSLDGPEEVAEGRAQVVDPADTAKLEVSFFGPFWGDYWVVDLGEDYEYAVVGHPGRDYLWVLSRTPTMDEAVFDGIMQRLEDDQDYPTDRFVLTVQE